MDARALDTIDDRYRIAAAGRPSVMPERWLCGAWPAACRSSLAAAGCLAFITASMPASAADAPLVLKVRPSVVSPGWTGFYAGGHAGYGRGKKKFLDNFPFFDGETDADVRVGGGLFGLQGGYNFQVDRFVFGIEGDFSWSDVKRNGFSCFTFGDQICSAAPEWFGTLAGRIGIANELTLFYLKGGGAWTRDHFSNLATCEGSQPTVRDGIGAACGDTFFANQTRFGWLIGAGIEYFVAPQWSVKLEYNYTDFGGRSVPFNDGGDGFFTEEIHQKINVVKAGINYHFDAGSAAASPAARPGGVFKAPSKTEDESSRVLAFSGVDVAKYSYSALAGALIAPSQNLDTSGLRVFLLGDGGTYKYPGDNGFIRGIHTGGEVLAGYGLEGDNYSINLLAGVNAINHMLSAVDTENRVQGTAFGAKVHGDAWVNPTARTLLYGEAEYSTAFGTYFAKAKLGYDVTKDSQVFVGPEVVALGDQRFNQWRAGLHVTQMKFGKLQVDVSGGYARDNVGGGGAYTTIEFSRNF